MIWQKVYDNYPVNRNLIWLNNCGTTPAGAHIVAAVTRFLAGYAEKGVLSERARYGDVRRRIKAILASLLHCGADELCLIHNTAEGMNFISHGLALKPGDEIILMENEYPSNVYPWWHWQEKGVRIRTAPMSETPGKFLENFKGLATAKTRVAALSAVHWCTGMPLPLEALGAFCRANGIELVVDGAQGVGMQALDVRAANISYMAFPAWKWLMGPLGLGVLYVAKEKLDSLTPVFMGTESVIDDQAYLPYKKQLKPTADRFILSTANFNDWVYFLTSLEFLQQIGFEKVRQRLMELNSVLSDKLRRAGCRLLSDGFAGQRSAICVFEKPEMPAADLLQRFSAAGIVAAERLGRIRLSPHIYNSFEQFDKVIDVLKSW